MTQYLLAKVATNHTLCDTMKATLFPPQGSPPPQITQNLAITAWSVLVGGDKIKSERVEAVMFLAQTLQWAPLRQERRRQPLWQQVQEQQQQQQQEQPTLNPLALGLVEQVAGRSVVERLSILVQYKNKVKFPVLKAFSIVILGLISEGKLDIKALPPPLAKGVAYLWWCTDMMPSDPVLHEPVIWQEIPRELVRVGYPLRQAVNSMVKGAMEPQESPILHECYIDLLRRLYQDTYCWWHT